MPSPSASSGSSPWHRLMFTSASYRTSHLPASSGSHRQPYSPYRCLARGSLASQLMLASTDAATIHKDPGHGAGPSDVCQDVLHLPLNLVTKGIQLTSPKQGLRSGTFKDLQSTSNDFKCFGGPDLGLFAKGAPTLGEDHNGLQRHHLLSSKRKD